MISFKEFVDNINLEEFYDKKLLHKKGGGRDQISPAKFKSSFISQIDWLKEKCITGDYKFSYYAEKLVLKGKGKIPRVLSVPTVRDRFVLALLNEYLKECYPIKRETPNRYIYRLSQFLNENKDEIGNLFFYKTDISSFYDNINHSLLSKILSSKVDAVVLKLIINAITTPTVSQGIKERHLVNLIGIPQGLSISNILAEIYLENYTKKMSSYFKHGLFLRYVDDILIVDKGKKDFNKIISDSLQVHNPGLSLSPHKTSSGKLAEIPINFIGYRIEGTQIAINELNRNRFIDRVVKRCFHIKAQFNEPSKRPLYINNDEEFFDFANIDLNLIISGFKVNNHNYGWIAYFQQMNDLKVLFQIDRLVKKSLGKELFEKMSVNSIVRTYHDLRENMGRSILIDFDSITSSGEKKGYLKRFGYIKEDEALTNEDIDKRFEKMIQRFIRSSYVDLSFIY